MIAEREWMAPEPTVEMGGMFAGFVMGHQLTLQLDDEIVMAELRKRGVWSRVEDDVRLGLSWLMVYPTGKGLDVFMWLGKPGDSGFVQYHLAGVAPVCAASQALLTSLRGIMKTVDREEYFEAGEPPAGTAQEC